jgi:hypothetical protein
LTRRIDVTPGVATSIIAALHAPAQPEALAARLSLPSSFTDQLADDNAAYAVLPPVGGAHVLLVSSGDQAIENALDILPGVHVTELSPADYAANGAPAQYDATIFDGVLPDSHRPVSGGILIWGGADRSFTDTNAAPGWENVVDWSRSDPVLRFTDLSATTLKAQSWSRVGDWTPLIETGQGIVAASSQDGGYRRIWMSFTPQDSGFASSPAFPIFISNAVGWLTQSSAGGNDIAGVPILLPRVKNGWSVASPGGVDSQGVCDTNGSPCAFDQTANAGVYTATSGQSTLLFARNCAPQSVDLVGKQHAFGPNVVSDVYSPGSIKVHRWQAVTGIATVFCLALLIGEWLIYHRPPARKASPAR